MIDDNDYEFMLEQQQNEERELLALREAQRLRDRQGQMTTQNKGAGGSDDVVERCESIYQRNVARRKVREAKEKESATQQEAPKKQPPAASEFPVTNAHTGARQLSNAPCGSFLLALKKGDVTWRLQLFASELSNGEKISYLRFQLWTPGEGGHPIKDGPGCGFSLSMKEAKAVMAALADGIRQVETGEFDPNAKGNYLPRRRGGSR
jgi:hypothetical protein